jgi:transcriptional regulator with XRE-family HTH domain
MMTATNSVNLLPHPLVLMNQTESADLTRNASANINDRMVQQWFSGAINRLADCTDDGGALLREPSQQYKIYIYSWHGNMSTNQFLYTIQIPVAPNKIVGYSSYRWISLPSTSQLQLEGNTPHLKAIQWIETATGFSQERIGNLIGVTRQTINGWKRGLPIADYNRRRLFAVRDVLERASLRHQTRNQLTAWLDIPRGADGRTPAQLLETNEIDRARLLAISSPSPRLKRAPSWVNQPIPEAFRAGAERRQEALPPETDNELAHLIHEEEDNIDEDGEVLPPI